MIKLFYALLMLFFCVVGIACFLYLFYVFNYNEKLWYFYFPVGKKFREGFWSEASEEPGLLCIDIDNSSEPSMWRINATLSHLPTSGLTNVSVEMLKSDYGLMYPLACLLAFLAFGLAYFIFFSWVAKVNTFKRIVLVFVEPHINPSIRDSLSYEILNSILSLKY